MLSVSLVIVILLFMQQYFVVKGCDIKCKKVLLFILVVLFFLSVMLSGVVRK